MRQQRFGEALRRFVLISRHDIDEILEEQAHHHPRRRFGEIALSLGLCQPEHVWQAWCHQLTQHTQRVDLFDIGIDAQATAHIPRKLAREIRVVPLRSFGRQIVVAVDERSRERAACELPGLIGMDVRLVLADARQIDIAMDEYYPPDPRPTDRAA